MLKNLLVLPDGQMISSGVGTELAIQSLTLTESVNSGEELVLGSACAAVLEATLFTPGGSLALTAGDEVTLYKVDDAGTQTKKGVFVLETPTRPSANILKLTGYDRMIKLDQDLTAWLDGLTGWPYTLSEFARMVCAACSLELVTAQIPNGDFPVPKFQYADVTGRQLMRWIGEIACCFCRADADGNIHLAWYQDTGLTVRPTGPLRYFAKGLSYETYQVAPVERVQLKLADSKTGALWPQGEESENSYIIAGNPILLADVSAGTRAYLQVIEERLKALRYTPCKISMPAGLQIGAGSLVKVEDKNGAVITACVMTKTGTGQRDTLECTGSAYRDSATASNNKSQTDKVNQLQLSVNSLDGKKVASLINLSEDAIKIEANHIKLEGVVTANEGFRITGNGSLEAVNATLHGKITATSGKIGGWNVDSEKMWSDDETVSFTPLYLHATGTSSSGGDFVTPASWLDIAVAGFQVGRGKTVNITVNDVTYHFTDGILTGIT